jgi:hypothetical protein
VGDTARICRIQHIQKLEAVEEYIVYKTYKNWRQLTKPQSWSTISVSRDPLLFKSLEDMTELELQEL